MRLIDADDLVSKLNSVVRCVIPSSEFTRGFISALNATIEQIKTQPTIEQPQWISCEERLPEEDGKYLVLVKRIYGEMEYYHNVLSYALCLENVDEYVFAGRKHGGWYDYDSEVGSYECPNVAYWMPLPDAPKGVE